MANSSKSSKSSSSSSKRSSWGLNKISFWTIVAVTVLYAIALILPSMRNFFLNSYINSTNSLNKLNGGLVITISTFCNILTHS